MAFARFCFEVAVLAALRSRRAAGCDAPQFFHAGTCESLPVAYQNQEGKNCDSYDDTDTSLRTLEAAAAACDLNSQCIGINDAYCNGIYDAYDFYALCLEGTTYSSSTSCVFVKKCPSGQFLHAGNCESLPDSYQKQEGKNCDSYAASDTSLRTLEAAAAACDLNSQCIGINDAYCNGMYDGSDFYSLCLEGTTYSASGSCVFVKTNSSELASSSSTSSGTSTTSTASTDDEPSSTLTSSTTSSQTTPGPESVNNAQAPGFCVSSFLLLAWVAAERSG